VKDLGLPTNHFRDMLVDNDTIVGYGLAYNDTINWQQGLLLTKFDSSGNLIASNLLLDSLGDLFSISKLWGKIIKTSDGGYAMTAATFYRESAFLIKVNHDLEVEFIKEYPDTVNLSNYFYKLFEISDGYILYGGIQRPNYQNQGFIRRVDYEGNTVWFDYFGPYDNSDNLLDGQKINDSLYVFAGVVRNIMQNESISTILLVDGYGNVVDEWESEIEPEIGYFRKILLMPEGGYLTFGLQPVDIVGSTVVVQPTLARLTADFEVEWINHFGIIASLSSQVRFLDIEPTSDGNYIGAGQSGIKEPGEPTKSAGWLMKFSPNGDSIWSRYDLSPLQYDLSHGHSFGGVGVLSSGSIVAGGSASEGQKKYIWLVKVTTDGCMDTLFCGLVSAGEEVVPEQEAKVVVYPNPASDFLMVEHKGNFVKDLHFSLFDVTGRPVVREELTGQPASQRIDLAGLAPGLYLYRVEKDDRTVKAGKVMVVKRD
jgi:Secretion system C-terminal sorting domain